MNKFVKILGVTLCVVLLMLSINSLIKSRYWKIEDNIKLEDLTQKVVARYKTKYLKPKDIKIATDKWKVHPEICLKSQSEDSYQFGKALAINKRYLAVGDPQKNRVVVYTRSKDNKWKRAKEIYPSQESSAYRVGSGFGHDLALDEQVLVIGAFTSKLTKDIVFPEDFVMLTFDEKSGHGGFSGGVYSTKLNGKNQVKRIDKSSENSISGWSVDADQGNIAYSRSHLIKSEYNLWNWSHEFNILLEDKSRNIFSLPIEKNEYLVFVHDIALKNNLFLIGNSVVTNSVRSTANYGEAWLYNLNTLKERTWRFAFKNYRLGDSVALSSKFAVVGGGTKGALSEEQQKILIKNIDNDYITIIDGGGDVFLNGNILARLKRPSKIAGTLGLLEIFELDNKAIPHLIKKYEEIENALLQNGFVIIVKNNYKRKKICIEKLI